MSKLIEIEGIGETCVKKLAEAGLTKVEELLQKGKDPKGRTQIAEKTGISTKLILRWVNMADLFRIKGVAEEYSDLLEAAGVDTVVELSRRNPENLYQRLVETNERKNLVRALPTKDQVASWVNQAGKLDRIVIYS